MEIRLREPQDDAEWLRMRSALWPEATGLEHQADIAQWAARPEAAVFVAVRPGGEQLAGFAEVGTRSYADGCETSPVGYLEGWYVDPDLRRQGTGAALLRAAEDGARVRGYREFASDAQLTNTGTQRAHEALDFVEVERAVP